MTTTTTMTRDFATYTVETYSGHIEVEITYTTNVTVCNTFQVFTDAEEMYDWIDKHEKTCRLVQIMRRYTQEMEGYSYYGSNPGIPEDVYDEVAEEILKTFDLK